MRARRKEVSFEELLSFVEEAGLITASVGSTVLGKKDRALRLLVQERVAERAGGSEAELARAVSPIELLLATEPLGPDGAAVREDAVTQVFAKRVGMPYVKLDPLKLEPSFATSVFSKPFAKKHQMLALEESRGEITVATANPFDSWGVEAVERVSGKALRLVIASPSDIQNLISEFYGFRKSVQNAEQHLSEGIDLGNLEQFVRMKSEKEIEDSDEHVVHAVEYLLQYAFRQRASDIHIEPKRADSDVRFRIDGTLNQVNQLPRLVHNAVVNRIKTLARLDIGEKRRPQDGRIKTEFGDRPVEIRVSTLPVAFGEKVVLRIFDPTIVHDDLGALGFPARERTLFESLIALPNGIVLVTGPTGSGKTTTLYTALRKLATPHVNITTIEDPIEMVFERINQTAIQPAIGLGFAECLRTILRQDPDIVMVGEIRDLDTARHAIQAALTGHLVFSTLHTNDAPSAVTRLLDLGCQDFLVASTVAGIMAQRLVKKVCDHCASERELGDEEIERIGSPQLTGDEPRVVRFGRGCVECRQSGYLGRRAIVEMMEVNQPIRRLISARADDRTIHDEACRGGMTTLREAAVTVMLAGETTYEQVMAVTREG